MLSAEAFAPIAVSVVPATSFMFTALTEVNETKEHLCPFQDYSNLPILQPIFANICKRTPYTQVNENVKFRYFYRK